MKLFQIGQSFLEASALDSTNVEAAFNSLVTEIFHSVSQVRFCPTINYLFSCSSERNQRRCGRVCQARIERWQDGCSLRANKSGTSTSLLQSEVILIERCSNYIKLCSYLKLGQKNTLKINKHPKEKRLSNMY